MVLLCGKVDCCISGAADQTLNETKVVRDNSANKLSYVGEAAYRILKTKHAWHHHKLWNVTSGKVVGSLHQTPNASVFSTADDPPVNHDDWFPQRMYEIMIKTKVFCDIMSLGPPDGVFLAKIQQALCTIANNNKSSESIINVRFLMGNIIGMPVNCDKLIKKITKDIPPGANIRVWVGSWRKGTSWNHAKLIAVDGQYLHTGGHNLWDQHYLRDNPVHDLSMEMEGRVAHDGHLYANAHWEFIRKKQATIIGQIAEKIPDGMPLIWQNRVIVSEYPIGKATEFPPKYRAEAMPRYEKPDNSVPVISVGRNGRLTFRHRPADDAFIAMFDSAKNIIRMSLQDIGPVCIPKTQIALPGCTWPKPYLDALARAIWVKGVDVEIVVSNPGSIPGGLTPLEAQYGNGWSCVDVAAEIIKRIKKQFPSYEDSKLRQKVEENLRICFIRHAKSKTYKNGKTIGNHSKFFIIDDIAAYVGSQNIYVADLAEWGVVVDDKEATEKMIDEFWNPLWEASYVESDCDVQQVMDGLDIDRDGEHVNAFTKEGRVKMSTVAVMTGAMLASPKKDMYCEQMENMTFMLGSNEKDFSSLFELRASITPPDESVEITLVPSKWEHIEATGDSEAMTVEADGIPQAPNEPQKSAPTQSSVITEVTSAATEAMGAACGC